MKLFVSAAAALAIASGASATIIYSTGFEAPFVGSAGGTAMSGQQGYTTTAAGFGISNVAANAHSGSQYAKIAANSVASTSGGSAWAYNFSAAAVATPSVITVTGWVNIAGTVGTRVCYAGFDCYTSAVNRVGALSIGTDGSILLLNGVDNGSGGTGSAATGAGVVSVGQWHQIGMSFDYNTHLITYSVDGVALTTPSGFNTFDATSTDFGGALVWGVRGSTGTNGTGVELRYDDLSIDSTIPAPATLALAGLGGMIAGRRRR